MINVRTFDLNLLRVFEAISIERSVSRAGDKLGLSQPAVSNALNRLREHFEDPLFVRTVLGMEPTPKAELLASFIHDGLATVRAGLTSSTDFNPLTSKRRFHLLMTDVGTIRFLPLILPIMNKIARNIDIAISETNVSNYADMLSNGLADLAIGRLDLDPTLCSELIHTSTYLVLVSRAHPALKVGSNGEPTISNEDFLNANHVVFKAPGSTNDPLEDALGTKWGQLRTALSTPYVTAIPTLIGGTNLIAVLPDVIASNLVTDQDLCVCALPFPMERNHIFQWWHKRNNSDSGHMWLRSLFVKAGKILHGPAEGALDSIEVLRRKAVEGI